jgi:RNA polymerase sigma factor (sigma-70 family)
MSRPDPILVEQLHRHDISAFDTLFKKYHLAVYRNILKLTKDATAAEDILQEAFIRLWEKRLQLDPTQSVAGWLFVISFNLSINYSKQKLREQVIHKKLSINPFQQEGLDSVSTLTEEQYRLLEKAIEQLSPQKRKIINLCKLEGKTYEEAAAELKISRHTVKEYLSAAMASLNDYVRKHASHVTVPFLLLWIGHYN